ncbi:MAG: excinuclease ABC subunit A, partial [Pirellulales bacterium]|nr:excinuclease ABC subunit A [Pirellulales bacterium]
MQAIKLRGVEVHNLQKINLDLPLCQTIVFCGVSGSGKTSLAIDTLYAEGQRRYIESFSPYTRQFLEQLPQPAAEKIEGIPASIAVTPRQASRSNRVTVATATEIAQHLQLLFAKVGKTRCSECSRPVAIDSPESVADWATQQAPGSRLLVTFSSQADADRPPEAWVAQLRQEGFLRAIDGNEMLQLSEMQKNFADKKHTQAERIDVIVDRVKTGALQPKRLRDSLETAFSHGHRECFVWIEARDGVAEGKRMTIENRPMQRVGFSEQMECADCNLSFPQADPRYFNFNNPLGACPTCEGFGTVAEIDMDLVVPDKQKTVR